MHFEDTVLQIGPQQKCQRGRRTFISFQWSRRWRWRQTVQTTDRCDSQPVWLKSVCLSLYSLSWQTRWVQPSWKEGSLTRQQTGCKPTKFYSVSSTPLNVQIWYMMKITFTSEFMSFCTFIWNIKKHILYVLWSYFLLLCKCNQKSRAVMLSQSLKDYWFSQGQRPHLLI